jgi:hypothetical protein
VTVFYPNKKTAVLQAVLLVFETGLEPATTAMSRRDSTS